MVDSAPIVQTNKDAIGYLKKYGYAIRKCGGRNMACMMGQHSLKSMIKDYQRKFKLPVTGELDFETKQLMNRPRCGYSDRKLPSSLLAQRLQGNHIWEHRRVTWSLREKESIYAHWTEQAFLKWKEIIPQFDFIQVCATCHADINISFEKGNHGDGEQNAFGSGTLAHASYPKDGTIHFNYDQKWTQSFVPADETYNFYLTAVHEIGHALGYVYKHDPHNFDDRTSIMHPIYNNWDKDDLFRETDKQAMNTIYPSNNGGGGNEGHWVDNNRTGQGIYTWPNNGWYEGQFKDGKMHGKGTRHYADGGKYTGDWVDNKRTGQGVITWAGGDRYEGQFKDDERTGQGIYTWANNGWYEGQFKDSKMHGKGTRHYADGGKYTGDWVDNKRTGQGAITWAGGDRYEGQFKDDERTGQGIYTWANNGWYEGQFKDSKMHGKGTRHYADGGKYTGDWVDNKRTGQGAITWAGGDRYEGQFKDDERTGQGIYTWANNGWYEGQFKDGKMHGKGTRHYVNGQMQEGIWSNNKFVG